MNDSAIKKAKEIVIAFDSFRNRYAGHIRLTTQLFDEWLTTEEGSLVGELVEVRKEDWISVKDGLPEKEMSVLCYRESSFLQDTYYVEVAILNTDCIWESIEGDNWNVTHWQPLPEPPKIN